MKYLGLRMLGGMLWAAAVALLVAGTAAEVHDHRMTMFAWCMFLCFGACTVTIWLGMEHVIERESARNARLTADAVGEAVGMAMREGDVVPITRRGT